MNISSIGIMQGRILPKYIDQLQIFPTNTWHEELKAAEDIGFEHIELLWDSKQDIKKAKDLMQSLSKLSILHAPSMCLDSISSQTSSIDIFSEIKDALDTFMEDTPSILVIPLLGKATINNNIALKNFVNEINEHKISTLLKKYNIKLALELDMPASEIIEALNCSSSELIGICLDSGNLWHYSNNPIDDILMLSSFIIHVHIKDRDSQGNNVLLGDGVVDFNMFLKALKNISYSGLLTLETKYFEDPPNEAKKNLQFIKGFL